MQQAKQLVRWPRVGSHSIGRRIRRLARRSVRPLLFGDEPMWPLPGLVFLEILAGALIGLAAALPGNRPRLLWIVAGVLMPASLSYRSIAIRHHECATELFEEEASSKVNRLFSPLLLRQHRHMV